MSAVPGGRPEAALLGLGAHRPSALLTNDDLAARLDTSDDWIRRRTGIVTRGIAGADETIVSMAVSAGAKALAAAGVDAGDLDLVLLATCTAQAPIPGLAPQVATGLGAAGIGAFDLNAACAGFCYGLSVAADAVRAGTARRVLVVASERLTDWIDADDRGMVVLFGDGAGAAVVGAAGDGADGGGPGGDVARSGIGPVEWGSDGDSADLIAIRGPFMEMEGSAVYRWATTALVPVARRACERAGLAPEDLAGIVLHQANLRIIEAVVRSLLGPDGAQRVVVGRDVVDSGNTSAASIPLALTRLVESGELRPGDPVLLLGFGAGLTYAGQVVRVP